MRLILSEGLRFFRHNRTLGYSMTGLLALGMGLSLVVLIILIALIRGSDPGLREGAFVTIGQAAPGGTLHPVSWQAVTRTREKLGALRVSAYAKPVSAVLESGEGRHRIQVAAISANLFDALVHPLGVVEGSWSRDETGVNPRTVVLSWHLAEELFHSPNQALGQSVAIRGARFRVAGVAPRTFSGLFGAAVDAWVPASCLDPVYISLTKSMGPAVTMEAQRSLWQKVDVFYIIAVSEGETPRALAGRASQLLRAGSAPWLTAAAGLTTDPAADARLRSGAAIILLFAAGLTLVGSLNFGGIFLARAERRLGEVRLRRCLGAGGWRLLVDLSAGPLWAVMLGSWAAWVLAWLTIYGIEHRLPWLRVGEAMSLRNAGVAIGLQFAFTLAVATFAAIIPAVRLVVESRAPMLSYTATAGKRTSRLLQGIVAAQMAGCIFACVVAVLVANSARETMNQPLGYEAKGRAVLSIDPRASRHAELSMQSGGPFPLATGTDSVLQAVAAIPGVRSAAMSTAAPLNSSVQTILLTAETRQPAEAVSVNYSAVSQSFFSTLKTRILSGHGFSNSSLTGEVDEAMVNNALAGQVWPAGGAVGQTVHLENPSSGAVYGVRIVGLVDNQRLGGPIAPAVPTVYLPLRGISFSAGPPYYLLVEGDSPIYALETVVNREIASAVPGLSVGFSYSLEEKLDESIAPLRRGALLAIAGALAVAVVAYLGLYMSLTYFLSTRRRDLAIRMSCGASPGAISGIVFSNGLKCSASAALLCAALSEILRLFLSRGYMGSIRWSTAEAAATTLFCVGAAALVSIAPAIRARRIPMAAALRDSG